ncbi:MAG: arginine--tRNA ligase [Burkholderiales bacterium]|nr:arginine--tRNA ligase [Burkholderiales bacterium]
MNYTNDLINQLKAAIVAVLTEMGIEVSENRITLERPKSSDHGDYACNIAMQLARELKKNPREIAAQVTDKLAEHKLVKTSEVAGPGFVNIFLSDECHQKVVENVIEMGPEFGRSSVGQGKRIQVEFVSANPTGPLHVGHGRGAAYGASIANLLNAVGYEVTREYYVNDAGRQMDILTVSTLLRYLELFGHDIHFPTKGYQGDYVRVMAEALKEHAGDRYNLDPGLLNFQETQNIDEEQVLDQLINEAKKQLGSDYELVHKEVLRQQLGSCKAELTSFGVDFDCWFSEQSLFAEGKIESVVNDLDQKGHLYVEEGATWFRSTKFGDEKDRVVQRDNGAYTYFASDIAYHVDKFERGFDTVINIWGADHHGYIPRVRAALSALGVCNDASQLRIPLVQFAVLYRDGEKVAMSTRSGEFVTLEELRDEVGRDAARFFYIYRKSDQHLDFDLNLAKAQNNENPVYYIQYAHARCSSILAKSEQNIAELSGIDLSGLTQRNEFDLMRALADFPTLIDSASQELSPHIVAFYLKDLAGLLHSYYNSTQILSGDARLVQSRLLLLGAVKQVIKNGLGLIGVNAPERM